MLFALNVKLKPNLNTTVKHKYFFLTINAKRKLHFNGFGRVVTENAHHVEEVFECQVAIIARREDVTYAVLERIHLKKDTYMKKWRDFELPWCLK